MTHHVVIRTGQVEIELSAQDTDFLGRQLQLWCNLFLPDQAVTTETVKFPAVSSGKTPRIKPDDTSTQIQPSKNLNPEPNVVTQPVIKELPDPVDEALSATERTREPLTFTEEEEATEPQPIERPESCQPVAKTAPDTANIPESVVLPLPEKVPGRKGEVIKRRQAKATPTVTDDFDQVLSQVMEDLEEAEDAPVHTAEVTQSEGPPSALIESLGDLFDMAQPDTQEDTLLLAAYYLTYFEGEDRLSLKQINAQLLQANESPVSHGVLVNIIETGYLQTLPDLTGSANVTEYQLTDAGRAKVDKTLKTAVR